MIKCSRQDNSVSYIRALTHEYVIKNIFCYRITKSTVISRALNTLIFPWSRLFLSFQLLPRLSAASNKLSACLSSCAPVAPIGIHIYIEYPWSFTLNTLTIFSCFSCTLSVILSYALITSFHTRSSLFNL